MSEPTNIQRAPGYSDALRKRAYDQLAAVMLEAGDEQKVWTNGFDPDISEMLANDSGGFFDEERYAAC